MTLKQKLGWFGALVVGVGALVVGVVYPPAKASADKLAEMAQAGADGIPGECPFTCDAGRGTIRPLDGGVRGICECP